MDVEVYGSVTGLPTGWIVDKICNETPNWVDIEVYGSVTGLPTGWMLKYTGQ